MEGNNDINKQFEREVFPTELIEIAIRRKEVFYPLDFYENQFNSLDEIRDICNIISVDCCRPLCEEDNRIGWLNDILRIPNLYKLLNVDSASFDNNREIIDVIKKYPDKKYEGFQHDEQYDIKKFNRLILEKKYEGKLPKVFVWKDLINELPEMDEVIRAHEKLRETEIRLDREKKAEKDKRKPLTFIKQIFENIRKRTGMDKTVENEYEKCKKYYEEKQNVLFEKAKSSTKHGLVGLALSGGGIRSATFNLGVLQALSERGVLKYVDYLSTVSGGGYIGSCLSSVLNNPETGPEKEKFPFRHEKGKSEPKAVKHLRNYGNYVAPNGILDWIKIPALFLRGVLINLLLLLPYVLLVVFITLYFYGNTLRDVEKTTRYVITESGLKELKSAGLSDDVLKQFQGKVFKNEAEVDQFVSTEFKNTDENWFVSVIKEQIGRKNFDWDWKTLYFKDFDWDWKTFRSKYFLTCKAGILYLFYIILFIFLNVVFCKNIERRTIYDKTFGIGLLVVFIFGIIESMVTALSYYLILDIKTVKTVIPAVVSLIPIIFAGKAAERASKLRGKLSLYLLGMLGPFMLYVIYLMLCKWTLKYQLSFSCLTILLAALVVFLITRIFTDINKTSFHNFYRDLLSKAYLFETDKGGNNVQPNDVQKLSELNSEHTKAPYHLINVALNLQGSEDINLRDRNADLFILSKHFCGSMRTGFCETLDVENTDPHVNLGTAMAISGAAAAPNMGAATIKPLVFIMTLLNIRLGYWLPNPKILWEKEYRLSRFLPYLENYQYRLQYWRYSPISGVGPIYLLRELFGLISEKNEYINVSDGGHIENLAIYELLRRRCKYIIACDAEADPDMTFGGLAKLIRLARIDLSIDIDIELDALRKGENGFSNRHCAFGKIHYGGGETGYLLYIKSSLSGDENEYIREYRSKNKDFPHESTGDQFFDEAQFEAYRALGYHIADKLKGWKVFESNHARQTNNAWYLACAKKQDDEQKMQNSRNRDVLNEWFKVLETSLLPPYSREDSFIEMQEQLSKIEKMYQDPDIAEYAYQVYPELRYDRGKADKKEAKTETVCNQEAMFPIAKTEADKERYRKIFHFCNQQMELMENVFIALQLDKPFCRDHHLNRGWMNLFQRWAEAPFFRWTWAASIGMYSIGFQTFCEEVLDLSRMISWRIGEQSELVTCGMDYFEQKKNKKRYLGKIWIADMFVCATPAQKSMPFPIGYIIVNVDDKVHAVNEPYTVNVMFYFIHKYYRKMGLLGQMITTLPDALKVIYGGDPRLCINFEREEDKSQYGSFFERHGFKGMVVSN